MNIEETKKEFSEVIKNAKDLVERAKVLESELSAKGVSAVVEDGVITFSSTNENRIGFV